MARAMSPAELRQVLKRLREIEVLENKYADQLEDAFLASLHRAQARAYEGMRKVVEDAPDFRDLSVQERLRWYIDHQRAVEEAIARSGYTAAVGSYVDGLPAFGRFVADTISAQGMSFIEFPDELLKTLRTRQLDQFFGIGNKANAALQQLLYDQVLVGRARSDALEQLRGRITGQYPWGNRQGMYEWHATTYARTNHIRYSRELHQAQADAHGLKNFLYIGPVDEVTRPFCNKLVASARTYTRAEIDAMSNGQPAEVASVFTNCGGYNCRHKFQAVSDRVAEGLRRARGTVNAPPAIEPPALPSERPIDIDTPREDWKVFGTLEEAQAYGQKIGLASEAVDYRGLHVSVANTLNREMGILLREFPAAQPHFFGSQAAMMDWAKRKGMNLSRPPSNLGLHGALPFEGKIWEVVAFPASRYGSPAALRKTLETMRRHETTGWMVKTGFEDPTRRALFHEFGHALDSSKRLLSGPDLAELLDRWSREAPLRPWIAENLCTYSAAVKHELFSEAFAEYMLTPNPRRPAREIMELVLRAHGRPPKGRP